MKLRWLILIAFMGVTLIPIAFLGIWPYSKTLRNEVDRVSDQHVLIAGHLKLAMERYYRDVVAAFDLLVISALNGQKLAGATMLMANVNFEHICFGKMTDGKIIQSIEQKTAPCPAAIPSKRLALFNSLVKERQTILTGVLANSSGMPTIYLLKQHGDVIAVGALNTNYLRELGKAVAFGERGHAAIVDQYGKVIAHPLDQWVETLQDISKIPPVRRMINGETGISKFYSPALKDDMIAGFTAVPEPGWGVMIPQPFSELEAKAENIQRFTFAFIMIGFLVAIAVAWVLTGYLIGPISAMAQAASRLGEGDGTARAKHNSKWVPFELRDLLKTFNAMADRIQGIHQELESRVKERTQELHKSEQQLRNAHIELEHRIDERTRDLRQSEQRFRDYAEAAADWFWEMDAELRFTYMSENVERLVGVSPEWHYGKTREELLGDDYDREVWAEHLRTLKAHKPFRNFEYFRVGEGIEPKWLRANGIPLFADDGSFIGYRGTGSDITELKQAEEKFRAGEEKLHQAQKIQAIGQLTGGVAHDFNNLLAVIQGNAELLAETAEYDSTLIQAILNASKSGAELTYRLLAFARQQPLVARPTDLANLVVGMTGLLQRTLGETIELEILAKDGLASVMADPGQVENALLNLTLNARDAMPGGGKLTVECAEIRLDDADVIDNPEAIAGDYVTLAVSDTGTGMTAEVRSHVFEPFFTTKEVGQGSGLGLPVVYGFAKQSGGHVTIYSEEGRGTTVKLYLPRSKEVAEREEAKQLQDLPRGKGEVVLVIEDDPAVRALSVRVLKSLGYSVIDVPDAGAAEVVLANGNPVDLVLSDVVLPGGTSGPEFAEKARKTYPDLKIIFMSGYPAESAKRNGFLGSDRVLLNKPFQRHQLARALRDALD